MKPHSLFAKLISILPQSPKMNASILSLILVLCIPSPIWSQAGSDLLMNGNFDTDLQYWSAQPDTGAIIHSSLDAGASPSSGSLRVMGSADVVYSAGQCVMLGGGEMWQLNAALRLDASEAIFLERVCVHHADVDCQNPLSRQSQIEPLFDTAGAFERRQLQIQTPPNTQSLDCQFRVQSDTPIYDFYLDQVSLVRDEAVFGDDFESGDTNGWSLATP